MSDQPAEGSEFEFENGIVETVFVTAEGRVLTVREYPDTATFEAVIDDAEGRGVNEEVADLSVEAFRREE